MARKLPINRTVEEAETELVKTIDNFSFIVNGLKDHEPYLRAVENFKETVKKIDDTWHLVTDPEQLKELRITKLAAVELINYVPMMELDLEKAKEELGKVQNPDLVVHKDYDGE